MAQERQISKRTFVQDLAELKRLWPYLRASKGLILIAVILIPLISLIQMSLPIILKYTIDHGIAERDLTLLGLGAGGFLVAVLLEYAARSGQSLTTAMAVHRMIRALRQKLISHVLSLSASYHDRSMSGSLVTRATSDFDNLSESLNMGVLTSIVDCAVLIGCLAGMFLLNWHLALIALAMLPLVGWIVAWFSRALKVAMVSARGKLGILNAFTQECLYGNSTIKLLTAENDSSRKYNHLNLGYRDAQMQSVFLDASMFAVLDGIASIAVGIILWMAIRNLGGAEGSAALSAGMLVAFVQYVQQLFEPMKQLGNKMAMLQGAFTSIDRIFGLLQQEDHIEGHTPPSAVRGGVEFKHVAFAYKRLGKDASAAPRTLHDVSFQMHPGESVALVGATGSGKSTVIKLITKLYGGYSGQILLDGQDLKDLDPRLLRRQMAIVPQDIVLFDGTVEFNISLGLPEVTRPRVEEAARIVNADRFIAELPGGYDFIVREQGANLSHGQRQLIAFARALAKEPKLIILDEATSSVDPQAERAIQSAIDVILKGHSVIVIAHRLSTIQRCDRIIVMGGGEILEQGKHEDLLAKKAHYHRLFLAAQAGPAAS